ncbi:MAG: hypothetical protein QOH39_2281 [Verrucomicrobiota bacterium]|jgi:hypothetical protein
MKKLTYFFIALSFIKLAYAGSTTFSDKEVTPASTTPTTSPLWYRDNEWNISAWFAYAFPGTDNDRNSLTDTFSAEPGPGTYDRFLADDHAFGGGAEVKYFFRRYFGIGIEGFALAADGTSYTVENSGATAAFKDRDEHRVGGALGTFTLRYPIGQTRFAPYVWAGGGGVFGGHNESAVYVDGMLERVRHDVESRPVGQFGGGFEVRVTPHIGLLSDFSWNVVDGTHNNFGLVRTGINFAF